MPHVSDGCFPTQLPIVRFFWGNFYGIEISSFSLRYTCLASLLTAPEKQRDNTTGSTSKTIHINEMHAHAVFAAQAFFIPFSSSRKGAANDGKTCTMIRSNGAGVSRPPSSSSVIVATRAASGGEASSSSSYSSSSSTLSPKQKQANGGMQRDTQSAAIEVLQNMGKENPWSVGTYHSKRATHKVNELGDIIGEDDAPENILQQPGWDDAGKLRFCISTVALELDIPEADVGAKMQQLFTLAPGLQRRVGDVKVADIVRMVASLPDVAAAFLKLRTILPNADLVGLWLMGVLRHTVETSFLSPVLYYGHLTSLICLLCHSAVE
jgi:hypothetical protein